MSKRSSYAVFVDGELIGNLIWQSWRLVLHKHDGTSIRYHRDVGVKRARGNIARNYRVRDDQVSLTLWKLELAAE